MICNEVIQSNDTYDIIVPLDDTQRIELQPDCIQPVSSAYSIYYYSSDRIEPPSIQVYGYSVIPACYGLLDTTALEVSGILALQNQQNLSLMGRGVLVGFLDTGINYTHKAFRNPDGSSRIAAIWDQTASPDAQTGIGLPANFSYGVEYNKDVIDRALLSDDPYALVPQQDENGHGTLLAGIACGSMDPASDFAGAAPESELVVVKLKPAKPHMRAFYYIPEQTVAYQENDLMTAVAYLDQKARELERPLVICVALGTNQGSHAENGALCRLLNDVGRKGRRCVVVATGNEAVARHHFYGVSNLKNAGWISGVQGAQQGTAGETGQPVEVEINVEESMRGFYLELWANAPELFAVSVRAPGGVLFPSTPGRIREHQEYLFLFENTRIEIDYYTGGRVRGEQLVFVRFDGVSRGIWTVYVHPVTTITGSFHVWLPMTGQLPGDVFFLRPDPDVTLTMPSTAQIPIAVGGYNGTDGGIYLESGRGYTTTNVIKPDFCAPAVNVQGADLRNGYVEGTGTSVAAAVTAGACAQMLEWGVVRQNNVYLNSAEIGNLLIRGCNRDSGRSYPNTQWGYGTLDIYNTFSNL